MASGGSADREAPGGGSGFAGGAAGAGDSTGGSAAADAGQGSGGIAAPDGGGPGGSTGGADGVPAAIETIQLPASGASLSFKTSLAAGGLYLLKATGGVSVGGQVQDAEFISASAAAGAMDTVGGTDVGIDVGLLQVHAPSGTKQVTPGPGRMKWFGTFRPDHTYYMIVTGAGNPLNLKLVVSGAGSPGTIPVSLFLLAAPPPAMNKPTPGPTPPAPAAPNIGTTVRESVQVPAAKMIVKTAQPGVSNAIYLIQASSAVRCGGGGLAMGDADYDDWNVTGGGVNNNDGACDFGVGVDESTTCLGPRARWWGAYRNDHVYFMLYTGTGNPISFLYYDSAYGDNIATDSIGISVFPVP